MNTRRRIVIVGLCLAAAAAAFPPWQRNFNGVEGIRSKNDAGYHFIADPPALPVGLAWGVSIDFARLTLEMGIIAVACCVALVVAGAPTLRNAGAATAGRQSDPVPAQAAPVRDPWQRRKWALLVSLAVGASLAHHALANKDAGEPPGIRAARVLGEAFAAAAIPAIGCALGKGVAGAIISSILLAVSYGLMILGRTLG